MSNVVLDASALLALLNAEPGAEQVASYLPGALINTVNLSEVAAKLAENGMPNEAVREAISALGLTLVAFDETLAYQTGAFRPLTKDKGPSLGDRAALATGLIHNLPVLTCDRLWQNLQLGVTVQLIR